MFFVLGEIGLTILSVFVLTILSGILIWSNWYWAIKSIVIILCGIYFGMIYFSIIDLKGWPTQATIPDEIRLLWGKINPPDRISQYDGAIYVWVLEKDDEGNFMKIPRTYELPYTKELHKQLQAAIKTIREGKRDVGTRKKLGNKKKKTDRFWLPKDESFTDEFQFYDFNKTPNLQPKS